MKGRKQLGYVISVEGIQVITLSDTACTLSTFVQLLLIFSRKFFKSNLYETDQLVELTHLD